MPVLPESRMKYRDQAGCGERPRSKAVAPDSLRPCYGKASTVPAMTAVSTTPAVGRRGIRLIR